MDMWSPNQILTIYLWFPLAVLLSVLLLIARFYQNLTGENMRYPLFVVPILLFGLASAHYANIDQVVGDPLGDLLWFAGGGALLFLSLALYRQMTAGR